MPFFLSILSNIRLWFNDVTFHLEKHFYSTDKRNYRGLLFEPEGSVIAANNCEIADNLN